MDTLLKDVSEFVRSTNRAEISAFQRRFQIGYNRAATIMDQLEKDGVVSHPNRKGERTVLLPKDTPMSNLTPEQEYKWIMRELDRRLLSPTVCYECDKWHVYPDTALIRKLVERAGIMLILKDAKERRHHEHTIHTCYEMMKGGE